MAQRDYVARNQKKRPTKKQAPTQNTPWFKVCMALLIIAGFIYALWFLTSTKPDASDKQSSPKAGAIDNKSGAKTDKVEEPLPVLKDEKWEFIEGLPNYSVEVDEEAQQLSDKRYLMQCGSFRTASQAEILKAQIAFQGLESQVLESKGSTGIWHRVVLGPFERKRDAERNRHQLSRGNINNCKIWLWD